MSTVPRKPLVMHLTTTNYILTFPNQPVQNPICFANEAKTNHQVVHGKLYYLTAQGELRIVPLEVCFRNKRDDWMATVPIKKKDRPVKGRPFHVEYVNQILSHSMAIPPPLEN